MHLNGGGGGGGGGGGDLKVEPIWISNFFRTGYYIRICMVKIIQFNFKTDLLHNYEGD